MGVGCVSSPSREKKQEGFAFCNPTLNPASACMYYFPKIAILHWVPRKCHATYQLPFFPQNWIDSIVMAMYNH